jgi:hypothetical protein
MLLNQVRSGHVDAKSLYQATLHYDTPLIIGDGRIDMGTDG